MYKPSYILDISSWLSCNLHVYKWVVTLLFSSPFFKLVCITNSSATIGRHIYLPVKGNAKECSKYHTIALISHASKVMLKILQARLQQYVNCGIPNVQPGFRKSEEPEIKLPTSAGSSKKQEFQKKKSTFALLTMPKPLTMGITSNCGKF